MCPLTHRCQQKISVKHNSCEVVGRLKGWKKQNKNHLFKCKTSTLAQAVRRRSWRCSYIYIEREVSKTRLLLLLVFSLVYYYCCCCCFVLFLLLLRCVSLFRLLFVVVAVICFFLYISFLFLYIFSIYLHFLFRFFLFRSTARSLSSLPAHDHIGRYISCFLIPEYSTNDDVVALRLLFLLLLLLLGVQSQSHNNECSRKTQGRKEGRSNERTEPSECMLDEVRMLETELSLPGFVCTENKE